jgi:hypothetical protein
VITISRCQCSNPCTCYFEFDGDRPNTNYTLPFQYGRYSTRKSGSGTAADPFVIEFLDSEEFLVEAGQIRPSLAVSMPTTTLFSQVVQFDTVDYDTPAEVFLAVDIQLASGDIYLAAHKFWFVSAEATFANNGLEAGTRQILVTWHPPSFSYGQFQAISIAGNSTSSLPAGAEETTVSCSGLAPMANFAQDFNFFGPEGFFRVYVQQNSGAAMNVRNVRFTVIAV